MRLPSSMCYGRVLDLSTDPYVECGSCFERFVGGDHESRTQRWAVHAVETGCHFASARPEKVHRPF